MACGHAQHIVVEGASMGQRIAAARIEPVHHVRASAEHTERQPAAQVFARSGQVRRDVQQRLPPAKGQARGHHLVQDQQGIAVAGQIPQPAQKGRRAGNAAARAQHGLHQNGCQIGAMPAHQRRGVLQVVVRRHQPVVGHIDRRASARKAQHPTVVGAVEHHHLAPAGVHGGSGKGHQIGFGAGVGEAHQCHGGKAALDLLPQPRLPCRVGGQVEPAHQRFLHGSAHGLVGVTKEACGEFAQGVDVDMAIRIPEPAAFTAHHGQGERRVVEHRAGVAAGQHMGRHLAQGLAARVVSHIVGHRCVQGHIQSVVHRHGDSPEASTRHSPPVGACPATGACALSHY